MQIITLFIIFLIIIVLILNNSFISIKRLIRMYKKSSNYVSVYTIGGLGNRLMSVANIIILSIFYESKPICINLYSIIYSN